MWILPRNLLQLFLTAMDMEELNSDSKESLANDLSQSVLVKSKPLQYKMALRRLNQESSTENFLSSRILRHSLSENFVDWWISTLRGSLASRGQRPDSEKEMKTQDISFPLSNKDLLICSQNGSSSKTSKELLVQNLQQTSGTTPSEPLFCSMSLENWKEWVTNQRQEYSQRVKSVPPHQRKRVYILARRISGRIHNRFSIPKMSDSDNNGYGRGSESGISIPEAEAGITGTDSIQVFSHSTSDKTIGKELDNTNCMFTTGLQHSSSTKRSNSTSSEGAIVSGDGSCGRHGSWGQELAGRAKEELEHSEHNGQFSSEVSRGDPETGEWFKEGTESSSYIERTSRSDFLRDLWPSRPGEPQYLWEPPRVIKGNSKISDKGRTMDDSNDNRTEQEIQTGGNLSASSSHDSIAGRELADTKGRESGEQTEWEGRQDSFGRSSNSERDTGKGEELGVSECRGLSSGNESGAQTEVVGTGCGGGIDRVLEQEQLEVESEMGGNVDGINLGMVLSEYTGLSYQELEEILQWMQISPNREGELRMLGNGVVPMTAEKAFRTLYEKHVHNELP